VDRVDVTPHPFFKPTPRMLPLLVEVLPLPYDACERILHHCAAMCIQSAWIRWRHFAHTRKKRWCLVRSRLGRHAWRRLIPYEHVRREWRQELGSWATIDRETVTVIVGEVSDGYWGARSSHLSKHVA